MIYRFPPATPVAAIPPHPEGDALGATHSARLPSPAATEAPGAFFPRAGGNVHPDLAAWLREYAQHQYAYDQYEPRGPSHAG